MRLTIILEDEHAGVDEALRLSVTLPDSLHDGAVARAVVALRAAMLAAWGHEMGEDWEGCARD